MSVGENIRRLREKREMTQAYVAEQVGISQAMLCQIERGTKNPSLQIGKGLADVLGCKIDSLLDGSSAEAKCEQELVQQ